MLKPVVKCPEEERAANPASAIEDAREEERGGLGQQRAVDVDEGDRRDPFERGPLGLAHGRPSAVSSTQRPIRSASSRASGGLGGLGDHPDDRLGIAGANVHPAVVPVQPQPITPIGTRVGARRRDPVPELGDTTRTRWRRSNRCLGSCATGYWSLIIAYCGNFDTNCDSGSPVAAIRSSTSAIATKLSRT